VEIPTVLRRPRWELEEPAVSEADVERLAELLSGPDWGPGDEGMAEIRELLRPGDHSPDDVDEDGVTGVRERPTEIFRARDEIADLLKLAEEEEWLVRLSYTSAAGKSSEVTVFILGFSGAAVLAQAAPRWTDRKYIVDRIGWARALTVAEEETTW